MKFDIYPSLYSFCFHLTPDEIALIGRVADNHYDWMCRATNMNGGILQCWAGWAKLDPEIRSVATFNELDLVCKVLEPCNYSGCSQFSEDEQNQCFSFYRKFLQALNEANKLYKRIEIDI
jgi:hypothetical protein